MRQREKIPRGREDRGRAAGCNCLFILCTLIKTVEVWRSVECCHHRVNRKYTKPASLIERNTIFRKLSHGPDFGHA